MLLQGPHLGKNNDLGALRDSMLFVRFRQALIAEGLDPDAFDLLGDGIFTNGPNMRALFRRPFRDNAEEDENALDQLTRIPVEWGFLALTQNWRSLLFSRQLFVQLNHLASKVKCCAILTNAKILLDTNRTLKYFSDPTNPFLLDPITLEDYFGV